jgi:hypothetical protein
MFEADSIPEVEPPAKEPAPTAIVQRRLEVGSTNDPLEHEADRFAKLVNQALASPGPSEYPSTSRIVRSVDSAPVERVTSSVDTDGGIVDGQTEAQIRQATGGVALESTVQRRAEDVLGCDPSGVLLHPGPEAQRLNEDVHAEAFTQVSQVFFRNGLPDTATASGRELLGHELTHTVQQSGKAQRRVQRKKTVNSKLEWVLTFLTTGSPIRVAPNHVARGPKVEISSRSGSPQRDLGIPPGRRGAGSRASSRQTLTLAL